MATIAFELHGKAGHNGGKVGPPATMSGIATTAFTGWSKDRTLAVTPAISAIIKVPIGEYEHTGETATGDWVYSPVNR